MEGSGGVRIGLLGLGAISQVVHLPILSQMEGAELVGVCDVDFAKARAIAGRFGIPRVYRTDNEVFEADDIDAIVICTPSHLHEAQSIAGLEGGKHVLVEKPLALDAPAAERVIRAAESAGRSLVVAMNNRYRPDSIALKPFVDGGELGQPFLVRGAWLNRKMRIIRPTWRHRRATAGGGAMMDLGVQTLDLALWLLGYPRVSSVVSQMHTGEGMEVEDTAAILLRLEDGAAISLTVSWSLVAERDRHYMRLLGTRGSGAISPLAVYKDVETGMLDVTPNLPPGRENLYTASYRQELLHFVQAVRGEVDAPLPHEQIELMRLVALAYRSAELKQQVEVEAGGAVE
jgi:predicted dehydrogenase